MQIENLNARGRGRRGRSVVTLFAAAVIAVGIGGEALADPASASLTANPAAPLATVAGAPAAALASPKAPSAAAIATAAAVIPAGATRAESLRRLDIMLMVTGLRCRKTSDDFRANYERFTTRHLAELNSAAADLRRQLVKQYGVLGSVHALDEMSTAMANSYGQGHPWLGCHDLKTVTELLVEVETTDTLAEAATQLLERQRSPQFAMASN